MFRDIFRERNQPGELVTKGPKQIDAPCRRKLVAPQDGGSRNLYKFPRGCVAKPGNEMRPFGQAVEWPGKVRHLPGENAFFMNHDRTDSHVSRTLAISAE